MADNETPITSWGEDIEERLAELEYSSSRQSSMVLISISVGGVSLGLAGLAFALTAKLSKVVTEVVNAINGNVQPVQQVETHVRQEPMHEYQPARPINHGVDETRAAPTGANVATPAMGPDTELTPEQRAEIENDPVAKLHRDRQNDIK